MKTGFGYSFRRNVDVTCSCGLEQGRRRCLGETLMPSMPCVTGCLSRPSESGTVFIPQTCSQFIMRVPTDGLAAA